MQVIYSMDISGIKLPKNTKESRYYYKNREAIAEKQKKKRMEDPVYQEKKRLREEIRKKKEEMLASIKGRIVTEKNYHSSGQNDQV